MEGLKKLIAFMGRKIAIGKLNVNNEIAETLYIAGSLFELFPKVVLTVENIVSWQDYSVRKGR